MALGATWLLNKESETIGSMLVDAHNGFNEMCHLVIRWNLRHLWPAGARFAFNFYKHWALILLRQPGDPLVILLIW